MNSGAILAMMISEVLAGDISNCSMVPRSRSLTMAAEATIEPFRISSRPNTPVTMNQDATRPGLNRYAGLQQHQAAVAHARRRPTCWKLA